MGPKCSDATRAAAIAAACMLTTNMAPAGHVPQQFRGWCSTCRRGHTRPRTGSDQGQAAVWAVQGSRYGKRGGRPFVSVGFRLEHMRATTPHSTDGGLWTFDSTQVQGHFGWHSGCVRMVLDRGKRAPPKTRALMQAVAQDRSRLVGPSRQEGEQPVPSNAGGAQEC